MQSTHDPATDLVSPARVLRRAARYLARHGWNIGSFYDRTDTDDMFPAACAAGAIRCAVFGRPVDLFTAEHTGDSTTLVYTALVELADTIDPTWWDDSPCQDITSCALEVVSDWNDTTGRTLDEVLVALYAAADAWDQTNPGPVVAVRS